MGKLEELEARIAAIEDVADLDGAKAKFVELSREMQAEMDKRASEMHAVGEAVFEVIDYLGLHIPKTERVLRKAGLHRRNHGRP